MPSRSRERSEDFGRKRDSRYDWKGRDRDRRSPLPIRKRGRSHSRSPLSSSSRSPPSRSRPRSRSPSSSSSSYYRRRKRDGSESSKHREGRKHSRGKCDDDKREPIDRHRDRSRDRDSEKHGSMKRHSSSTDNNKSSSMSIYGPAGEAGDSDRKSKKGGGSYYKPSSQLQWGKQEDKPPIEEKKPEPQYKPDFGLSGALAKDEKTGNMVNGVVLKFTEPAEAATPDRKWRLYVYKGSEIVETLHIHRRSCFLLGRDGRVADVPLLHPSCSLQHAVIQYRSISKKAIVDGLRTTVEVIRPYLMDLNSSHGTFLNGEKIEGARYYELKEGDLIKFATSTREYVILHDKSV